MSDSAFSYARTPDVLRELRRLRTSQLFGQLSAAPDPEAQAQLRDQLVLLNVGVARHLARRYHHRGLEDDDIDQTAHLALVRAVQGFDPGRGHDFLTYAVPTIRGEIKHHFRDTAGQSGCLDASRRRRATSTMHTLTSMAGSDAATQGWTI